MLRTYSMKPSFMRTGRVRDSALYRRIEFALYSTSFINRREKIILYSLSSTEQSGYHIGDYMVFGKLRSKLIGRREEMPPSEEAIREHVLGELHPPGTPPFPPTPAAKAAPRGHYGAEFEGERAVAPAEIESLGPPSIEEFPRPETPITPPREFERRIEERGIYELMDRLSVIEAQLATIRAQTETLNERMKTLEMYLRSRMPRTTF